MRKETKILRPTFTLIALGFTLISAWNGFDFYSLLFGFSMALLITSVFETARVACLFLISDKRKSGALVYPVYIMVASVCAFASINSFTTKVIIKGMAEEKRMDAQIHELRKAYSERLETKLEGLARDIRYIENMIAKYPKNDYWKRRLGQIMSSRDSLVAQRDLFLSDYPEDREKWIKKYSALLGTDPGEITQEAEEVRAVKRALREMWNLDKNTAEKIVGIVVTITVEISILLLIFLSRPHVKWEAGKKLSQNGITKDDLKRFVSAHKAHYRKTGRLPPLRKLSPKMRKVRKMLETLNEGEVKRIFDGEAGDDR